MEIILALLHLIFSPLVGAAAGALLALNRLLYLIAAFLLGWEKHVDVRDQFVVVTGGVGGFGSSLVKKLLSKNARVIAVDIVDAQAAAKIIGADSDSLHYFQADLSKDSEITTLVQKIRNLTKPSGGKVFGLINNAGIALPTPALQTSVSDLDRVMKINLYAGVELSRQLFVGWDSDSSLFKLSGNLCTGGKAPTRSRIVNITSVAGLLSGSGMCTYFASKTAFEFYTDAVRLECGEKFLDCVAIEPYFAQSQIYRNLMTDNNFEGSMLKEQYLASRERFKSQFDQLMTSDFVADYILQGLLAARPQDRYMVTPNWKIALLMRLIMHLPNFWHLVDGMKRSANKSKRV